MRAAAQDYVSQEAARGSAAPQRSGSFPGRGCGARPSWDRGCARPGPRAWTRTGCPSWAPALTSPRYGLPLLLDGVAALARVLGEPRVPRRPRARRAPRALAVPPSAPGASGRCSFPASPAVLLRRFAASSVITLYLKTEPFQTAIWEANPLQNCLFISFNVQKLSF